MTGWIYNKKRPACAKCYSASLSVLFSESKVINYKITTASSHRPNAKALKVLPRGATSWHVTGCTTRVKVLEQCRKKCVATKYRLHTAWGETGADCKHPAPPCTTPTNKHVHTRAFLCNRWKQIDQKTLNLWVYSDETCWAPHKTQIKIKDLKYLKAVGFMNDEGQQQHCIQNQPHFFFPLLLLTCRYFWFCGSDVKFRAFKGSERD